MVRLFGARVSNLICNSLYFSLIVVVFSDCPENCVCLCGQVWVLFTHCLSFFYYVKHFVMLHCMKGAVWITSDWLTHSLRCWFDQSFSSLTHSSLLFPGLVMILFEAVEPKNLLLMQWNPSVDSSAGDGGSVTSGWRCHRRSRAAAICKSTKSGISLGAVCSH